jgi:PAS domain-containing protein
VIVGSSTIARDMTQARQAYELARAMIEASQDSLVSINPDGRITDANEATVKVTGVSREELIGTASPTASPTRPKLTRSTSGCSPKKWRWTTTR